MIKALHAHIGVGKLRINRDSANLVINKLEDLILVILPHFDKYPVVNIFLTKYFDK